MTLIILRVADLAAASLDGLFEHPAGTSIGTTASSILPTERFKIWFFNSLLGLLLGALVKPNLRVLNLSVETEPVECIMQGLPPFFRIRLIGLPLFA